MASPPGRDAPRTRPRTAGGRSRSPRCKARDFKLDGFKWLKDDSLDDADDLPEPEELVTDAVAELAAAIEELNLVMALLEDGSPAEPAAVAAGA